MNTDQAIDQLKEAFTNFILACADDIATKGPFTVQALGFKEVAYELRIKAIPRILPPADTNRAERTA